MKYCPKCGTEMNDEDNVCCNCGASNDYKVYHAVRKENSGLKTATKVFLILSCVFTPIVWFIYGYAYLFPIYYYVPIVAILSALLISLIPLAWLIPMTVHYFNSLKNDEPVGTGFKVCTLIFVSMIGGILMLCDNN